MSLSALLDAAHADPALAAVDASVDAAELTLSGPPALAPFAIAELARTGRTVLAVTSGAREAEDLLDALRCLVPPDQVALYPGWDAAATLI